jgi:hypothetical protein
VNHHLLRITGEPVLVRRRIGPALFRAGLLNDVDIVEVRIDLVVRLHRRIRIDIAHGPVIVGRDFEPVVDAAQDDI